MAENSFNTKFQRKGANVRWKVKVDVSSEANPGSIISVDIADNDTIRAGLAPPRTDGLVK